MALTVFPHNPPAGIIWSWCKRPSITGSNFVFCQNQYFYKPPKNACFCLGVQRMRHIQGNSAGWMMLGEVRGPFTPDGSLFPDNFCSLRGLRTHFPGRKTSKHSPKSPQSLPLKNKGLVGCVLIVVVIFGATRSSGHVQTCSLRSDCVLAGHMRKHTCALFQTLTRAKVLWTSTWHWSLGRAPVSS